jgi:peptidoglycan/xylan/chitin deacetylase (PgdA/CDA1 family)
MYEPKPIDTTHVELPTELAGLIERLAENNHDLWARGRMAEGWSYGPRRDDVAKRHPDLVPYRELPESEKEYDRQMATGTIKAILAAGYQVVRP